MIGAVVTQHYRERFAHADWNPGARQAQHFNTPPYRISGETDALNSRRLQLPSGAFTVHVVMANRLHGISGRYITSTERGPQQSTK